ncbi:MAG: D-aminoacylase [Gemmatimonadetes bacterium]|nr:D-aminoacylase [Gemmatimonadota bacterium]
MDRRAFLRTGATSAGAAFLGINPVIAQGGDYDLVLRNGLLFDGLGSEPMTGDVAIRGERIAAIGRLGTVARGTTVVDLGGLALSPGFVDIHSHTDLSLLVNHRAESKIRQGVTTEVTGQDGSSIGPWSEAQFNRTREDYRTRHGVTIDFRDLSGFFARLERERPAVNVASMVGQGTVRGYVVGADDRPATAAELERMQMLVRAALAAGACGMSTGLEYTPSGFASTAELAALATALAVTGLPYSSHMRNEDERLFAAVEEAITIASRSGVPVQISHLKAQGQRNWWKSLPVIQTIRDARASGLDVAFDVYPYIAYSTGLANLFPLAMRDGGDTAFLGRLRDADGRAAAERAVREKVGELGSWNSVQVTSTGSDSLAWARGRRLGTLAEERGEDPFELLLHLVIEDRNRAGMVGFGMSEENVEMKLAEPLSIVCSDGGAWAPYGPLSAGSPHPRTYGAFPRVLGHYARDRNVLSLQEAIRKMTSAPARRLRLEGRGELAVGAFADLVAFDPSTVADQATFEQPHQYPRGIPHVLVNGTFAIRDGEHTDSRSGRVVRPRRG